MFQDFIDAVVPVSIMIDGVPYAPVVTVVEELLPIMIGWTLMSGILLAFGCRVGQGLANLIEWVFTWLRSRKASKAEESVVMDPQILEALDKLTPEELTRLSKAVWARNTES